MTRARFSRTDEGGGRRAARTMRGSTPLSANDRLIAPAGCGRCERGVQSGHVHAAPDRRLGARGAGGRRAWAHPDANAVRAAPATPGALPFKATLSATTHRPRATQLWHYTVRVVDLKGRPIQARARFQIVFAGPSAPPPRRLGSHTFRGSFTGTFQWPRATRGEPLVFQAVVTAKGATRRLSYSVRVR